MFEYACQEGNYGLQGQMTGGRADDKAGQKTTSNRSN
jgi:hypothetical protein